MFGLIGSLIGWIAYHLGLRTDAASASGSLHAKVKYLNDTTVPAVTTSVNANVATRQKPRGTAAYGTFSTTSTAYVTAKSVSGTGKFLGCRFYGTGGTPYPAYCRITIDGVQIGEVSTDSASWVQFSLAGATAFSFKTSLLIEIRTGNVSFTTYVDWIYEVE